MPTPAHYRVLNPRIRYPADARVAARLAAGAEIDSTTIVWRIVYAGSVVADIPASAIPVLLAQGDIEPTTDALADVLTRPRREGM